MQIVTKSLLRSIAYFLGLTALGLFAGIWYANQMPKVYESRTILAISGSSNIDRDVLQLSTIALSSVSLDSIITEYRPLENSSRDKLVEVLRKDITVGINKNETRGTHNLVTISVRDTEPRKAQKIAAEIASRFVDATLEIVPSLNGVGAKASDFSREKTNLSIGLTPSVRVQEPASLPMNSVSPNRLLVGLIGLAGGLLIALVLIAFDLFATTRVSKNGQFR